MTVTAAPFELEVLVIGCGIAGLTTAVACREKGFNVTVLESSLEFSHVSCKAHYSGRDSTPGAELVPHRLAPVS
jgi:2-polyprenyl-6-methoxyphenol hydroxylase-like FAD-dependent oxidoreductase